MTTRWATPAIRRAPLAAFVAVIAVLLFPRPASACLAVDPPTWQIEHPPRLVMTVTVLHRGPGSAATVQIDTLIRGRFSPTFRIVSENGCELPTKVHAGDRLVLVSGETVEGAIPPAQRLFSTFSGPMWRLEPRGAVTGSVLNGVTVHSFRQILRLIGLPDTGMPRPEASWLTALGVCCLLGAWRFARPLHATR